MIFRGTKQGGGVWEVATPPECWMEGLNTCQPPPPDFEKIFIMRGWLPLNRNSKNWTFYSVKILNCESFLIALRKNSKKETFLSRKI